MRVAITQPPSAKELERLYCKELLGSGDISLRLNIPRSSVQYWLKKYGIPTRTLAEAAALRERKPDVIEFRRQQLRAAQENITPEGRRRQAEKVGGPREPWSDKVRDAHAYRQTPEYRQKLSDAQKGEKAHNWRGGMSTEHEGSLRTWEWRARRKECYERDKWTCQDCGCKCVNGARAKSYPARKIQAHHVKSRRDGGLDDLSNLVTLCMSCHMKRESKEAKRLRS